MDKKLHRYKLKVNSVPNIATILSDIVQNAPTEFPVVIDSEVPIHPEDAHQYAFEGVVEEVLGAVIAGLDIELVPEES